LKDDGVDERRRRAKRNAILLALVALGFYAAFLLLKVMESSPK
jgi:hypothetical protein